MKLTRVRPGMWKMRRRSRSYKVKGKKKRGMNIMLFLIYS